MKSLRNALVTGVALLFSSAGAMADVDDDTYHARINEANHACEVTGEVGVNKQLCVSHYLCTNYGDCEGENMQPIESTPGGGVYRDTFPPR